LALIDLTDLLHHHMRSKTPSGIQRVQGEVTARLLDRPRTAMSTRLVCHVADPPGWVEVPRRLFDALMAASGSGGGRDVAWQLLRAEIHALLTTAQASPPDGAVLLNLGSSWWLPNYLLAVREAREKSGLRYLPFVHDCIPLLRPDLCALGLPAQFLGWLAGAGLAADGMIASTAATAGQIQAALTDMAITPPPVSIVPLDARPRLAETTDGPHDHPAVPNRPYVLFVSTLERRKDHALAFRAWLDLAGKHSVEAVPRLVCVGNPGWRNEAAYGLYAGDPRLAGLVSFVSDIDDAGIKALYARCLCTLYPSLLEGWGLPVTESLSFGKIPIVARTTGSMEAAGVFGEFFAPGSLADLVAAVERVCFDVSYRIAAEARIAEGFRPRSWQAVADAFSNEIAATAARPCQPASHRIAGFDRYFAFSSNRLLRPSTEVPMGEHLRSGSGWLSPEPWGCPTRPGTAEFVMPIPASRPASLAVCLRNGGTAAISVTVSTAGGSASHVLRPGQTQWAGLALEAGASPGGEGPVTIRSDPDGAPGHSDRGVGVVGAMAQAGRNVGDCIRCAATQQARHLDASSPGGRALTMLP